MTQEPDFVRGPGPLEAEACPEAATGDLPQPFDGRLNPFFDRLPDDWNLPGTIVQRLHGGGNATRSTLIANARRHAAAGNAEAASLAYRGYARACWAAGVQYAEALRAARQSLELRDDAAFRGELADQLESVGAHLASARLIEEKIGELDAESAASLRRRLASLSHRAGDAEAAALHFSELARIEPEAIDALIAIGTMAGWAPEQVSRERGVVAWHEAARRHKSLGALLPAFELAHRAFELDMASSLAAERLARELEALGRREAADEVWRQSAVASGDDARHDVRAVAALDAGDIVGAFAAMLDGRADSSFEMAQLVSGVEHLLSPNRGISRGFDMVLAELGCADWLAVRLEIGPLLERWTDEANCHVALGRLEASYFVHLDAAREALVRAIIVNPGHPEARARLSNWATNDDAVDPLLRALVQSARAAQGGLVARQLAGELLDRDRDDPSLASLRLWALERMQATGHLSGELRALQSRWLETAAQQQVEWSRLQSGWSEAPTAAHLAKMCQLEGQLAVDPGRAIDHLTIAMTLVELDPDATATRSLYVELLDVAARLVISPTRDERLARALENAPRLLGERGCIARAKFHLRHGQIEQALSALLQLLDEPTPSIRGLLWLFTLARRFRDALVAARTLERITSSFRPAIRGVLEAIAADLYLEARAPEDALRIVSNASRTGQSQPRLVTLEARLADYWDVPVSTEAIERALSKVLPNAQLCRVLSLVHMRASEPDVALAWIHRALSLRPGDVELRNLLIRLSLEVGDVSRVADVLDDLMTQALPVSAWVESAASALAWVTTVDAERAISIAKRLLGFVGASDRTLRAALLDVASVVGDELFAVEVLERAAAVAEEDPAIHLALAERHWKRGDFEAATFAALRAARVGAAHDDWQGYISHVAATGSAEAALGQLELERLRLIGTDRTDELREALRNLAVARFDLANDTEGAVAIWRELAQLGEQEDLGRMARDMGELLGHRDASVRLLELANGLRQGARDVKALGMAAQLSLEAGDAGVAMSMLEQGLACGYAGTGLLPLAEVVAAQAGLPERLESLYQAAEHLVLGRFAERTLHFRAARAFERTQQWHLALRHALSAFEAFPDGVATWQALVRISRGAGEPQALAHAAMHAAEASSEREYAHRWLARAYIQLGAKDDELRLKFDLAIRMLVGVPQVSGVFRVAQCIRQMQDVGIEEVDFMRMRFERALESLMAELEGPDGARLGIAISEVATTELGRFDIAAQALLAALKADADLEEFSRLAPILPRVTEAKDAFLATLHRAVEWLERPYVQIGEDAARLLVAIGATFSDAQATSRILLSVRKHGRAEALGAWIETDLLDSVFVDGDGRRAAIVVAAASTLVGDGELALDVLGRAAELSASRRSETDGPLPLDVIWHAFSEQYSSAAERVTGHAGIDALRMRCNRLEPFVPASIVAELRVKAERRSGDLRALCNALSELAFVGTGTSGSRVEILLEAAAIAEELGDRECGLAYLRAAVDMQGTSVAARLALGIAMVRMDRHRSLDQAQLLFEIASGLETAIPEEQRDLAVFLQAEALEALGMVEEAYRLLEEAELRIGPRPLIVLGMAEHALRMHQPALALGYFAAALGGNLRELRPLSRVSLTAARAAAAAGDVSMALQWLEAALLDAATRPDALVLQAELLGVADVIALQSQALPLTDDGPSDEVQVGQSETGVSYAAATSVLSAVGHDAAASNDLFTPQSDAIENGHGAIRSDSFSNQMSQSFRVAFDAIAPDRDATETRNDANTQGALPEPDIGGDARPALRAGGTPEADAVEGVAARTPTAQAEIVESKVRFVEPTALEMAILLGEQAAADPQKLREWLADGRRQLRQWPLSVPLAELVQKAAGLESHASLVNALSHAIGVLRGDAKVLEPTELAGPSVDADAVRSLLIRDLGTPELEALALVWDGAEHEFLREASDYEITGVMRVVGSTSTLARSYAEIAPHFGLSRTPLFHKRGTAPLTMRVLLLSQTAVLLEGDSGEDELTLSYRVGCALWATIPDLSLLFGETRERSATVLRGLFLAFGTTGGQPNPTLGESLRMAQVLWQTVKSRSQRRLKEICAGELDVDRAMVAANQSLRRAGLYACGDLRTALAAASVELGVPAELVRGSRWDEACRHSPELLDLWRFAESAEYADVRWKSGRSPQLGGRGP